MFPCMICHELSLVVFLHMRPSQARRLDNKYISNHFLVSWTLVRSFLSRPKYAIRGIGILGRIWLGSSAAFGGRLQRPSPCRVRSAHRRERGRVSSETSECRGKILEKMLNLNGCNAWMIYKNWHHFQTVRDNVWNFALSYSRAVVSLLYFFTSSFGFLLGILLLLFLLVLPAGNSIFLEWVHLKRDTNYRRYPTTSRHK